MEASSNIQDQARKIDAGIPGAGMGYYHYPDYDVDETKYDPFGNYVWDQVPPITHEDLAIFDSMGIKDASKIIFDLLTASDNQNATVLITGPPGAGKDYLANDLSYNVGLRIADHLWRDPGRWREAYPYWKNTAIINPAEIIRVMEGSGELEVRRLDDVFRAMDRVEYYTEEHQYMNTLQSVNRIENSCTIMTAQYSRMVDSIIRNLSRFWIRVFRNKLWRGLGFNEFVMYVLEKNELDTKSEPYQKSIRDIKNGRRRVHDRGSTNLPVMELLDWYRPRRKTAVEELKKIRKKKKADEAIEERHQEEKATTPQTAADFTRQYKQSHPRMKGTSKKDYTDEVHDACINAGFDVSRKTVSGYLSQN